MRRIILACVLAAGCARPLTEAQVLDKHRLLRDACKERNVGCMSPSDEAREVAYARIYDAQHAEERQREAEAREAQAARQQAARNIEAIQNAATADCAYPEAMKNRELVRLAVARRESLAERDVAERAYMTARTPENAARVNYARTVEAILNVEERDLALRMQLRHQTACGLVAQAQEARAAEARDRRERLWGALAVGLLAYQAQQTQAALEAQAARPTTTVIVNPGPNPPLRCTSRAGIMSGTMTTDCY